MYLSCNTYESLNATLSESSRSDDGPELFPVDIADDEFAETTTGLLSVEIDDA